MRPGTPSPAAPKSRQAATAVTPRRSPSGGAARPAITSRRASTSPCARNGSPYVGNSNGLFLYSACRPGLRYERKTEVKDSGPLRQLLPWAELADLIAGDPRRAAVAAWAASLPDPAWRQLYRPHELWPQPEMWHPSYIEGDHAHPGWTERRAAWATVQDILTDAIGRIGGAS